mmetsp:Transcript_56509/g.134227  ORF Transcript_56509/g.134227 Transcript_56509/m.134227 type:complete len:259 (-) Transcript_56509:51-827(-)
MPFFAARGPSSSPTYALENCAYATASPALTISRLRSFPVRSSKQTPSTREYWSRLLARHLTWSVPMIPFRNACASSPHLYPAPPESVQICFVSGASIPSRRTLSFLPSGATRLSKTSVSPSTTRGRPSSVIPTLPFCASNLNGPVDRSSAAIAGDPTANASGSTTQAAAAAVTPAQLPASMLPPAAWWRTTLDDSGRFLQIGGGLEPPGPARSEQEGENARPPGSAEAAAPTARRTQLRRSRPRRVLRAAAARGCCCC